MYNKQRATKTSIKVNQSAEGETIEMKVRRIMNNNEPIKDGAPIVYTERKDGVVAEYDIRTDRFEVAVEAMDKGARSETAKRKSRMEDRDKSIGEKAKEGMKKEGGETGGQPIQGGGQPTT